MFRYGIVQLFGSIGMKYFEVNEAAELSGDVANDGRDDADGGDGDEEAEVAFEEAFKIKMVK